MPLIFVDFLKIVSCMFNCHVFFLLLGRKFIIIGANKQKHVEPLKVVDKFFEDIDHPIHTVTFISIKPLSCFGENPKMPIKFPLNVQ